MENGQKTNSNDPVNHPSHYNQYHGFEVIDVCEQLKAPDGTGNYNRGTAFKYLARAGWKDPSREIEDLEKSKFFVQREIDRLKFKANTEQLFHPENNDGEHLGLIQNDSDTTSLMNTQGQ